MARKRGRRLAAAGLIAASASLAAGGAAHAATGDIFTVAGSGATTFSGDGGPATAAGLQLPTHVAAMPDGGFVISDATDYRVRRVGASGRIKTIAGTGVPGYSGDGGPGELAQLSGPSGLAAMADGSVLIADLSNNRIRRVASDGTMTTFAGNGMAGFAGDGGPATSAQLRFPNAVAVAGDGSVLIADRGNERVRRVSPTGTITTVAGDGTAGFTGDGGPAAAAELNGPVGVAAAPDGGVLIADSENNRIRRVAPGGTITTVAGTGTLGYSGDGGPATSAQLGFPMSITVAADGSFLVADMVNQRIRRIAPAGTISTLAGTGTPGFSGDGGPATAAQLGDPSGVAAEADGDVLIADSLNNRVRMVDADLRAPTPAAPATPTTPAPTGAQPAPRQAGQSALTLRIGSLRRTGRTVTLRYRLSAPAKVTVKLSGLKAIKRAAKAGDNTLRFKLPKRLKAGRRTLALTARSADGGTATAKARLTVKNPTPRG